MKRTRTTPVVGDGTACRFADTTFDAVICSLSFHHLTDAECAQVLREMWRTSRGCVLVNDLHRHPLAYAAIWVLARLFSHSVMVKHDGPASVSRAFRPADLQEIANRAGRARACASQLSVPARAGGDEVKHVDVVIIGGSLAGAACVRELARRGIDAVAFERDRFPREKVCGGFLSPGAVDSAR